MEQNVLKNFYKNMELKKYPINATFAFVYNDYNTYIDDPHLEECFDDEEVHEIVDSVSDLFEEIVTFESENAFINWCTSNKKNNKKIYVYTMAQCIEGFARRALIPSLCQYYGFINLNADAYSSTIGCNKETMFKLLTLNSFSDILAPTIFVNRYQKTHYAEVCSKLGNYVILKPISESCCIDTFVLKDFTENEFTLYIDQLLEKYGYAMIQKYIPGQEIGITVICHNKEMYTLSPMEIVFAPGKCHLTHQDSYYCNYKLRKCPVPSELLEKCKKMSEALEFYCVTRYDFRCNQGKYFLFDVSPNPTVNGYTSSNFAARATLGCDHRGILRLMAYEKLALFEPSFKGTL